jgi:Uncharacterized membrane protein (DUF2298)
MLSSQQSSTNLEAPRRSDPVADRSPRPVRFWLAVLLVAAVWLVALLSVHADNSRLLPSWHGFLHAAIATRFPISSIPPENPFFAGEPIPYYWLYHYAGSTVARIVAIDLLHAFRLIALSSLVVLVVFAGLTGRKYFRSTGAGLMIGYLALVGLNPLGPAIALGKHLVKATPLLDTLQSRSAVENVFVSDQMADDWMTQPLLPALHISSEWWHGQNIVWFLDISARAPALALVMVLLFLLLGRPLTRGRGVATVLVAALVTALNPIAGIAVSGSLAGASLAISCLTAHKHRVIGYTSGMGAPLFLSLACLAGAILALPTYYHLILLNEGTLSLTSSPRYAWLKLAALSANFLLLVPLAVLGNWKAPSQEGIQLRTITVAGILLLLAVPVIILWPHNEHNLTNVAQCLLAVPAVAWVTRIPERTAGSSSRRSIVLLVLFVLFLPTTICTLFSFTGRPDLPLGFRGQTLQRLPEEHPLENLYAWIRSQTPINAVFISDPNEPVKMSGNVSELPAFTSRTLFTDQTNYLTMPYKDGGFRAVIANDVVNGRPLTPPQLSYVRRLGRPFYLITYHAEREDLLGRLIQQHGKPLFHQSFVAVFELVLL